MTPRDTPQSLRTFAIRIALAIFVALLILTAVFFWPNTDPQSLYRQALATHDLDERISLLRQAANAGNFPEVDARLCLELARANRWNDLEAVLVRANSKWPDREIIELASLCTQAAQWDFVEHLVALMSEQPELVEPRLVISCHLFQASGRRQELLTTAEELTRFSPKNARHWWQLARIHEQFENSMAAIKTYEAALGHDLPRADRAEMQQRLLDLWIDVGELKSAQQLLKELAANGASGPRLEVSRSRILHLAGQTEQALHSLQLALHELGDSPEGLRMRGVLYSDLGQLNKAIADFRRVTELTPHDEIAYFKLAEAYRRQAQEDHEEATRKLADKAQLEYLKLHKRKLRIRELTEELKRTPDDEQIRAELSNLIKVQ